MFNPKIDAESEWRTGVEYKRKPAIAIYHGAQSQKHVTHNEAIRALDALVQILINDKDLTAPPAAPVEGARYIPAAGASGDWLGKGGQIAAFQDSAWMFYQPLQGWLAYIADEAMFYVYDGSGWVVQSAGAGGIGGPSTVLNCSTRGAATRFKIAEEEMLLAGAFSDSTIVIPQRAMVFAVTTRTTALITGTASYDCGIAGNVSKYGGTLGIAAGSTNSGVTGPTAFYADTPIRITANGRNFTGGKVRFAIHYMLCDVATL